MPAVDDPEYGVVVTLEQNNFIMDDSYLTVITKSQLRI